MSMRKVRLVIIDSVAAIFRADFNQEQMFARARHLCSIGSRLRELAAKYSAAVVVVNQVTADMNAGSGRYVRMYVCRCKARVQPLHLLHRLGCVLYVCMYVCMLSTVSTLWM